MEKREVYRPQDNEKEGRRSGGWKKSKGNGEMGMRDDRGRKKER